MWGTVIVFVASLGLLDGCWLLHLLWIGSLVSEPRPILIAYLEVILLKLASRNCSFWLYTTLRQLFKVSSHFCAVRVALLSQTEMRCFYVRMETKMVFKTIVVIFYFDNTSQISLGLFSQCGLYYRLLVVVKFICSTHFIFLHSESEMAFLEIVFLKIFYVSLFLSEIVLLYSL
jgi:hypothetical protein